MRRVLTAATRFAKGNALLDGLIRYNPLYYTSVRRTIAEMEVLPFSERVRASHRLLQRTLEWARRIRPQAPTTDVLSDWPILEKEDLRGCEAQYRNRRVMAAAETTSGTTGIPLTLWRSLRCMAAEQAFFDQALAPFGIACRATTIAKMFSDDLKPVSERTPPFGYVTHAGRRLRLSSKHLNKESAGWYADALRAFQPQILWGLTSGLVFLAQQCLEQHRRMHVPVIIPTAEILTPAGRRALEDAFGGTVLEQYGSAERVVFCTSRRAGQYFVAPAYGYVELKPLDGDAPVGYRSADVIGTGFWNEAMPLVRYRLQDRIVYPDWYGEQELAEVAMGLKPFTAVDGRQTDFLIADDGTMLLGIDRIAREVSDVLQVQVVQEDFTTVQIRVIPTPGYSASTRRALMDRARMKIPSTMQVDVQLVEALERLPSGKTPGILRRVSFDDCRVGPAQGDGSARPASAPGAQIDR